jgi:6-pyruvoyltetrahydropterin/6-carboxytetrahydropterin synthase
MISITRIFKFEAAHCLPNHPGKCKNLHGHSYKLEVEVTSGPEGLLNSQKMIMDFGDLKSIVNPMIDEFLDHHFLNESLDEEIPTAEVMVTSIANWMVSQLISPLRLIRVRLWETENSYAEWRIS